MHIHEYEMKADGVTHQMDRGCGTYVCWEDDYFNPFEDTGAWDY